MTVKIVGHWERSWRSPIEEYEMWIYPIREFGLTDFYMCPITGIQQSGRCFERHNIDDVFTETDATHTRVFVDENATDLLPDFVHPTDALYIIGKTSYSPYLTHYREGIDKAVKIPSVSNNGGFWGEQAATMILYDRFLKGV